MKKANIVVLAFALAFSGFATAAEEEIAAKSLAELLELVKEGKVVNKRENEQREREFQANKANQQSEVNKARRMQREEEAEAERLEGIFENNEQDIAAKQEILAKRLGSLRELFGVLQQVSGDTQGVFEGSIVSAQLPGRGDWLGEFAQSMGKSSKLATIEEIERLWFELQREMTESAKITRFNATVVKVNGDEVEQEVIRVGSFNLISGGQYVTYDINTGDIKELARQPAALQRLLKVPSKRSHRLLVSVLLSLVLGVLLELASLQETLVGSELLADLGEAAVPGSEVLLAILPDAFNESVNPGVVGLA